MCGIVCERRQLRLVRIHAQYARRRVFANNWLVLQLFGSDNYDSVWAQLHSLRDKSTRRVLRYAANRVAHALIHYSLTKPTDLYSLYSLIILNTIEIWDRN